MGAILWLCLFATGVQPSHLVQEVHALLPATPQHHAVIHHAEEREPGCEKPKDDVSQPLSGGQHERHHEAQCSSDGQFFATNWETPSAAPQAWDVSSLDFAPAPPALRLEAATFPRQSRAPPPDEAAPLSASLFLLSGRAPPIKS